MSDFNNEIPERSGIVIDSQFVDSELVEINLTDQELAAVAEYNKLGELKRDQAGPSKIPNGKRTV